MSDDVKKIIEERMKETAKQKDDQFVDHSDMYMAQFKNNFGQMESRNSVGRQSIGKGGPKKNTTKLTIKSGNGDEDDSDEDDDWQKESFGKRGGGGLAQMKAKLSLKEELGALKSELDDFDSQQPKQEETANSFLDMDGVEERDDADNLDDEEEDDEDEFDRNEKT